MKVRSLAISVLVISAAISLAQADHSKAFWVKKYNGIANMFATKNMKAFIATLDPKFVYVDDKGKTHSRDEFIKMEADPISHATAVSGTVAVTGIQAKGDTVAVSYDWRYKVTVKGPQGTAIDTGREVGTDTWQKVGGNWLTIKTVVKSATDKMTKG